MPSKKLPATPRGPGADQRIARRAARRQERRHRLADNFADLPDKEPTFLIGYLTLEFAAKAAAKQDDEARTMLSNYGDGPRNYRNGIALAIPDKKPMESLRRAVRYLMAVERVEAKKKQHKLTKDQEDQLKERRRTEEAAAETAFRQLYPAVWLPRVGKGGAIDLEKVEVSGPAAQSGWGSTSG